MFQCALGSCMFHCIITTLAIDDIACSGCALRQAPASHARTPYRQCHPYVSFPSSQDLLC
eukprot:1378251-Karenia_brevis.AAC.1